MIEVTWPLISSQLKSSISGLFLFLGRRIWTVLGESIQWYFSRFQFFTCPPFICNSGEEDIARIILQNNFYNETSGARSMLI